MNLFQPRAALPVLGVPSVVLGLDLSLKRAGWGLHDLDGMRSGAQSFKVGAREHPALRFYLFGQWLACFLWEHKPDVVVYERPSFKNMKFNHSIYCAVGLASRLDEHCALLSIPLVEVMPNTVKLAFTGNGNADKDQMKARACELWPDYDPAADVGGDEADARAITWCWLNRERLHLFEFAPLKAGKTGKKSGL